MAFSKTYTTAQLGLPSSYASIYGNITVTIDNIPTTNQTVDDSNKNQTVYPKLSSVTRSSSTNTGSNNFTLNVAVEMRRAQSADSSYLYYGDASFGYQSTSTTATKGSETFHQKTRIGLFEDSIATETDVTIVLKVWSGAQSEYAALESQICSFKYGLKPVITQAVFADDLATLPTGWNDDYVYNRISIPKLHIQCAAADQPTYCVPYWARADFDAADAPSRMTAHWVFNGTDDYVEPAYYSAPNLNSGVVPITVRSKRETEATTQVIMPFRMYSAPEASTLSAFRSDSSGNPLDEGTDVHVEGNVTVYMSNDTQDAVDVTIELYDGSTKVAEKSLTLDGSSVAGSWDRYTLGFNWTLTPSDSTASMPPEELADLTKKYTVTVTVEDDAKSGSSSEIVPMAFYTFHSKAGGHGVGIGKPSTIDGLLDVGMDINVDGDIKQNGTRVMPVFAVTSWSTSSDESTLPATPCIVLSLSDMGLYHCTG